jgi:hypothetical protein
VAGFIVDLRDPTFECTYPRGEFVRYVGVLVGIWDKGVPGL